MRRWAYLMVAGGVCFSWIKVNTMRKQRYLAIWMMFVSVGVQGCQDEEEEGSPLVPVKVMTPDVGDMSKEVGDMSKDESGGMMSDGDIVPFSQTKSFAANLHHLCVSHHQGIWCWGRTSRLLKDAEGTYQTRARKHLMLEGEVTDIDVSDDLTCVVQEGQLKCSGEHESADIDSDTPWSYGNGEVESVRVSRLDLCIIEQGALKCRIPQNSLGHTGPLLDKQPGVPMAVMKGMEQDVTAVDISDDHGCAIKAGGLYCWGDNTKGAVSGDLIGLEARRKLVAVKGLEDGVTDVAVGSTHTCAIARGLLYCWGYGGSGMLGAQTLADLEDTKDYISRTPLKVRGVGQIRKVWASMTNTCALVEDRLWCWGSNADEQLYKRTSSSKPEYADIPIVVSNISGKILDVALAQDLLCVKTTTETTTEITCRGTNGFGQLGLGHTLFFDTPKNVLFAE